MNSSSTRKTDPGGMERHLNESRKIAATYWIDPECQYRIFICNICGMPDLIIPDKIEAVVNEYGMIFHEKCWKERGV
jgi:hypothetical protein